MNIYFFPLVLDATKHFEKSVLVLLFDTNSGIHDRNSEEVILEKFDEQQDLAVSIRELESVAQQV
jgi:hypothetical protein